MLKFPKKIILPIIKYFEREKKKIEKRLSSLKKEDPFADRGWVLDKAASDTEAKGQFGHLRVESLKKELINNLEKIEKALSNLRQGKYGICEKCGKMIDTERLKANPTASLCLDCEKKLSQK